MNAHTLGKTAQQYLPNVGPGYIGQWGGAANRPQWMDRMRDVQWGTGLMYGGQNRTPIWKQLLELKKGRGGSRAAWDVLHRRINTVNQLLQNPEIAARVRGFRESKGTPYPGWTPMVPEDAKPTAPTAAPTQRPLGEFGAKEIASLMKKRMPTASTIKYGPEGIEAAGTSAKGLKWRAAGKLRNRPIQMAGQKTLGTPAIKKPKDYTQIAKSPGIRNPLG